MQPVLNNEVSEPRSSELRLLRRWIRYPQGRYKMKKGIQILLILSCSSIASNLWAQEKAGYYWDQQSIKFRDGVYTSIDMVKNNSPIPSSWIVTDMEINDRDFFKAVTRADEIVFHDDNGVKTVLDTKSVWGYSHQGDLHINVGGAFHKMDIVGSISHFYASKTTNYLNPLVGGYYTMDFWSTQPILVTARNEEYIVDIMENKVRKFDMNGLESVLKNDPQLWNDYMNSKKQDKQYLKYIFIHRYNKKYPLDIPVY